MKMGKAGLPTVRLRFGTKTAFDALATHCNTAVGSLTGLSNINDVSSNE
jgi:hypothetical protein